MHRITLGPAAELGLKKSGLRVNLDVRSSWWDFTPQGKKYRKYELVIESFARARALARASKSGNQRVVMTGLSVRIQLQWPDGNPSLLFLISRPTKFTQESVDEP